MEYVTVKDILHIVQILGCSLFTVYVENALTLQEDMVECAVVEALHKITGEVQVVFVTLEKRVKNEDKLLRNLTTDDRHVIGTKYNVSKNT